MQPLDVAGAPPYVRGVLSSPVEGERPRKRWWRYIPLGVTVGLMLAPHPSILYTLVQYYLVTKHSPLNFLIHLLIIYSFTFLAFSSLILCSVRDPGPVNDIGSRREDGGVGAGEDEEGEMSLTQALMVDDGDDFNSPAKWCRKCWMPKPERAHHCSICGRCVLKMDHHCPWVADKCIGHWTYPAFLHFLFSITSLALYIALLEGHLTWMAFVDPFNINETVALNSLLLAVTGIIFAITIGSFLGYHIYLVTTNQTTLETLSPFLLLRYIPLEAASQVPIISSVTGRPFSQPPEEFELSSAQRRLVRHARGDIRMYDLGWKQNWSQVFGWKRRWGWVPRVFYGGGSYGDGKTFPRSTLMEERLADLASRLVNEDKLA